LLSYAEWLLANSGLFGTVKFLLSPPSGAVSFFANPSGLGRLQNTRLKEFNFMVSPNSDKT